MTAAGLAPCGFRRRVAQLAVLAVLLQAVLFGWHHHIPVFAAAGVPVGVSSAPSGGPHMPAADDDSCDICIALHHQTAAPAAFVLVPLPSAPVAATAAPAPQLAAVRVHRPFDSRAPPLL